MPSKAPVNMTNELSNIIQEWALRAGEDEPDYNVIDEQIEYFAINRYYEYLPTVGPHLDFRHRLAEWIIQLKSEADQKTLFRLVPNIFFVQRDDMVALYRAVLRGPITRWCIDLLGIELDDPSAGGKIASAISTTWFCPITDSMHIAEFYHVNGLTGVSHRPDWRSLRAFGDRDKILKYMTKHGLERIVLLEDFIGSGQQMGNTIAFAASLSSTIPVLAVPLIVCPRGAEEGRTIASRHENLQFNTLVVIQDNMLLHREPQPDEPQIYQELRGLVERCHTQVSGTKYTDIEGPYGYKETGALLVTYSNCPNNTLPIIHHNSDSWSPLFPRTSRL